MEVRINTAVALLLLLCGCSVQKRIGKAAGREVINSPALQTAHVGISIYEPATGRYLYNYQGNKYFVPASNVKLATCYAAMKYLGDSLVGLRYDWFDDTTITITPSGDPTFLHPDFKPQPALNFLKQKDIAFYLSNFNWQEKPLGLGWSWNDYNDNYMAERSAFPLGGNTIILKVDNYHFVTIDNGERRYVELEWALNPSYFTKYINSFFALPLKEIAQRDVLKDSTFQKEALQKFYVSRELGNNSLNLIYSTSKFQPQTVPFVTNNDSTAAEILRSDYSIKIQRGAKVKHILSTENYKPFVIHSQPTDSLLKPMMHRSDNFFAEQALLMVSNEHLGYMNDEAIIDTLLKTDFAGLPQKPRWADGSGLSRYNLFTPQDMVAILQKMKTEFGMPRIKNILATGGEGTLSNYFVKDSTFIYAKTGTLSGVVALSGFVYTKKGKELIFSVLVNNHQASATTVRRAVEKFITDLREKE